MCILEKTFNLERVWQLEVMHLKTSEYKNVHSSTFFFSLSYSYKYFLCLIIRRAICLQQRYIFFFFCYSFVLNWPRRGLFSYCMYRFYNKRGFFFFFFTASDTSIIGLSQDNRRRAKLINSTRRKLAHIGDPLTECFPSCNITSWGLASFLPTDVFLFAKCF